jgi:hypothetical protein
MALLYAAEGESLRTLCRWIDSGALRLAELLANEARRLGRRVGDAPPTFRVIVPDVLRRIAAAIVRKTADDASNGRSRKAMRHVSGGECNRSASATRPEARGPKAWRGPEHVDERHTIDSRAIDRLA